MSGWQLRDVALKFQVSDWTAFSVPLRLHMRSIGLSERVLPDPSPKPPIDHSLGSAAGYMIRALPVDAELPTLSVIDGYLRYVTLQYRHCFIDLSIGMEAYKNKFSAKTRSTITRKLRKFQEHCGGQLRWQGYFTPNEMEDFHRLARTVSLKTYQERLLSAGIPDDPVFVDGMRKLAERDEVRAYLLFDGERPVSYLYCPAQDGALIYAYLGYDPDYLNLSVGTVLQWLALEALFAEGRFAFFDFTEGQSDHKRLFATHELPCANIIFLKRSLPRELLLRTHALSDHLASLAGRLVEHWGLKARIRRILRFGVAGSR